MAETELLRQFFERSGFICSECYDRWDNNYGYNHRKSVRYDPCGKCRKHFCEDCSDHWDGDSYQLIDCTCCKLMLCRDCGPVLSCCKCGGMECCVPCLGNDTPTLLQW